MTNLELFDLPKIASGAEFSPCRKYRYALWRIWEPIKPRVMFIGLNPSTANETETDPTIKSVIRIAKANGFGGVYMMNCFPFVSTDPDKLINVENSPEQKSNNEWLKKIECKCDTVVFAWGAFKVVKKLGRDIRLINMFPDAKCLAHLKDGSPKHPLYCKSNSVFVPFTKST